MFLENQSQENRDSYFELLKATGSLSRLFSENKVPYLYYRAHENIFCRAFEATNESRGDVAVDAVKDKLGIGLKTFIYKDSQFEKIAEFNKLMPTYSGLKGKDLAGAISHARNERINSTSRIYNLSSNIYHCVARQENKFLIYEVDMPVIDIENINSVKDDGKIVEFYDNSDLYRFNRSKSTLFKKFNPVDKYEMGIEVLKDPYQALLELFEEEEEKEESTHGVIGTVILPLYSTKGGEKYVPEKSGLNQWNAAGRPRNDNEVYIKIPLWIHRVFEGFFPGKDVPFDLRLPNGNVINVKVCQAGKKALMSNPNSAIGEWILRGILGLEPGELLTYKKLMQVGIDSISITKSSNGKFDMNVRADGTFEEFENKYSP